MTRAAATDRLEFGRRHTSGTLRIRCCLPATAVVALFFTHLTPVTAAPKDKPHRPANEVDEQKQFIEHHFEKWDINRDGSFGLKETNLLIRREGVRGREAAMIVAIHCRLNDKKDGPKHFTRDECVKLAEDNGFRGSVFYYAQRVEATDHVLFLPGDPKLTAINQGFLGDCYYVARVGAAVHLKPEAIREMIRPVDPSGKQGYEVSFGCGKKIVVHSLTDGELMLGSMTSGEHGIWLAVLEKAYGLMRARASAKEGKVEMKSSVPLEFADLGAADKYWPITSLFTGHVEEYHDLKKDFTPEKLHHLLIELTNRHRLISCVIEKDTQVPPGVVANHEYGILGYESGHRLVVVFNPWGNDFKPEGSPGLAQGYLTEHGVSRVPLVEFQTIFTGMTFETDQKWHEHERHAK